MTSQNLKKNIFLPRLMKLGILVAYKFLTKNINFGVTQCISGHVISQNMEFIKLAISQPFLKIETSGLDQKNSIKLCAEHFTILEVIEYISGHVTGD